MKKSAIVLIAVSIMCFSGLKAMSQEQQPGAAPARVAADPYMKVIPRFDVKDIYGRIFPADTLAGWIVVYGFGNDKNADEAIEWLKKITFTYPDSKGVLYVIVADSSKFPRIMYPFVKKVVKEEYEKQLAALQKKFTDMGINVNYPLDSRYIMVIDSKAELFDVFGIKGDRDKPHAFILDGNHRVRGHFTSYSDELPATLAAVMADRDKEQQFSLKTRKAKKNTMKKVAIGAAAVSLALLIF
ncbi:MAG TPA: hypothetical protein PLQ76_06780 [bacterium]|nr:hypothetical protein [bacterium]